MTEHILEFQVTVNVKASEETKKLISEMKEAKKGTAPAKPTEQKSSEKRQQIPQKPEKIGDVISEGNLEDFSTDPFFKEEARKKTDEENAGHKETMKFLDSLDSKGLGTLKGLATNPTGTVTDILMDAIAGGATAAEIASGIGILIATPTVITMLLKALSVKGGPLNRDFLSFIGRQVNVGLTRQQIQQKQAGIDVTILVQKSGFIPNNANWNYNSLFNIDAYRLQRIGLEDRAAGLITP